MVLQPSFGDKILGIRAGSFSQCFSRMVKLPRSDEASLSNLGTFSPAFAWLTGVRLSVHTFMREVASLRASFVMTFGATLRSSMLLMCNSSATTLTFGVAVRTYLRYTSTWTWRDMLTLIRSQRYHLEGDSRKDIQYLSHTRPCATSEYLELLDFAGSRPWGRRIMRVAT